MPPHKVLKRITFDDNVVIDVHPVGTTSGGTEVGSGSSNHTVSHQAGTALYHTQNTDEDDPTSLQINPLPPHTASAQQHPDIFDNDGRRDAALIGSVPAVCNAYANTVAIDCDFHIVGLDSFLEGCWPLLRAEAPNYETSPLRQLTRQLTAIFPSLKPNGGVGDASTVVAGGGVSAFGKAKKAASTKGRKKAQGASAIGEHPGGTVSPYHHQHEHTESAATTSAMTRKAPPLPTEANANVRWPIQGPYPHCASEATETGLTLSSRKFRLLNSVIPPQPSNHPSKKAAAPSHAVVGPLITRPTTTEQQQQQLPKLSALWSRWGDTRARKKSRVEAFGGGNRATDMSNRVPPNSPHSRRFERSKATADGSDSQHDDLDAYRLNSSNAAVPTDGPIPDLMPTPAGDSHPTDVQPPRSHGALPPPTTSFAGASSESPTLALNITEVASFQAPPDYTQLASRASKRLRWSVHIDEGTNAHNYGVNCTTVVGATHCPPQSSPLLLGTCPYAAVHKAFANYCPCVSCCLQAAVVASAASSTLPNVAVFPQIGLALKEDILRFATVYALCELENSAAAPQLGMPSGASEDEWGGDEFRLHYTTMKRKSATHQDSLSLTAN